MDAHLKGNLTAEPEARTYDSGKTKVTARVAVNDSYVKAGTGERVELTPLYFTVEQWEPAPAFLTAAKKGSRVAVMGTWRADEWHVEGEDKPRRRQYVLADVLTVLPSKQRADDAGTPENAGSTESQAPADKWADAK